MKIELTQLSGKYGAPMGRHDEGNVANATTLAVEWMPFVDGDYDVGAAYWGGGQPLYCVVGYNEDGEEEVRQYHRAANRGFLINDLREIHCFEGSLLSETGSIVKQTIALYNDLLKQTADEVEVEALEEEITDLQSWLEEKGLP